MKSLTIYHAVDEYSAYAPQTTTAADGNWQETIRKLEKEVIGQADLVFVTSPGLYESKRHLHPHVYPVPNGVDYDSFSRPTQPPAFRLGRPVPPAHRLRRRHQRKTRLPLLEAVASAHPDWQFIFIGPIASTTNESNCPDCRRCPTCTFLGRKAVDELPDYLHPCDVCLIPYKRNEWTRNISPLKLYEYLATGAPIVSTDIPAAREFADDLWLASDQKPSPKPSPRPCRRIRPNAAASSKHLAQAHSWDNRVETLSDMIENHLKTEA